MSRQIVVVPAPKTTSGKFLAHFDDFSGDLFGDPTGWGATEDAAREDLLRCAAEFERIGNFYERNGDTTPASN